MSNMVEKTAKTVQEAIELALEELDAQIDDVEIEVVDEGTKGIFGIGSKLARVRVSMKNTLSDKAAEFLADVLGRMQIEAEIEQYEDDESIQIKITGRDSGIIIGRRGETLDALQYLTSLVVNKQSNGYKRVAIDIENYRKKREETLIRLADRVSERVMKYRKSVMLEPMNPYERRIIHSSLQENKYVETHSVGEEPNRKVVIALKHGTGGKRQYY